MQPQRLVSLTVLYLAPPSILYSSIHYISNLSSPLPSSPASSHPLLLLTLPLPHLPLPHLLPRFRHSSTFHTIRLSSPIPPTGLASLTASPPTAHPTRPCPAILSPTPSLATRSSVPDSPRPRATTLPSHVTYGGTRELPTHKSSFFFAEVHAGLCGDVATAEGLPVSRCSAGVRWKRSRRRRTFRWAFRQLGASAALGPLLSSPMCEARQRKRTPKRFLWLGGRMGGGRGGLVSHGHMLQPDAWPAPQECPKPDWTKKEREWKEQTSGFPDTVECCQPASQAKTLRPVRPWATRSFRHLPILFHSSLFAF